MGRPQGSRSHPEPAGIRPARWAPEALSTEVLKMNLVDLILTVCLTAHPGQCRVEHLHFESHGSLMQCMLRAPTEIAKWAEEHPTLKIKRWKCAFPSPVRNI
jgi:hypothetical protein